MLRKGKYVLSNNTFSALNQSSSQMLKVEEITKSHSLLTSS